MSYIFNFLVNLPHHKSVLNNYKQFIPVIVYTIAKESKKKQTTDKIHESFLVRLLLIPKNGFDIWSLQNQILIHKYQWKSVLKLMVLLFSAFIPLSTQKMLIYQKLALRSLTWNFIHLEMGQSSKFNEISVLYK